MNNELNVLHNDNKKIVFFDIDDTLYTPALGVPESAKAAIRKLRENGHLAFICTGRAKAMIFPSILDVGFDGIVAGAGTYAEYDGQVIMRQDMSGEVAAKAVDKLRMLGYIPIPEGHDYLYHEHRDRWTKMYGTFCDVFWENIGEKLIEIPTDETKLQISKSSALFTEESDYEGALKAFEGEFTVVNHGGQLLELIPMGSSKAEGIKKVIEHMNISWENTYALGDSMNDYEMISYVKYGIAMGNADKRIIDIANYVTDTVENDGVYKALKHYGMI